MAHQRRRAGTFPRLIFPIVRQYDVSDCAPACLATIVRYYGGSIGLEQARIAAGTNAEGSTLAGLFNAAQGFGFKARAVHGAYTDLASVQMPCIAHLSETDLEHYVVVFRVWRSHVLVGDPARGQRLLARPNFERLWTGYSLLLEPPAGGFVPVRASGWKAWFDRYTSGDRTSLHQAVFLGAFLTVVALFSSAILQVIIDRIIPTANLRMLWATGLLLAAFQLVRAAATFVRARFATRLTQRIATHMTSDFFDHVLGLPASFFATRSSGDITARLEDPAQVQEFMSRSIIAGVPDLILLLGGVAGTFYFLPLVGWIGVAALPIYVLILWIGGKRGRSGHMLALGAHGLFEALAVNTLTHADAIRDYDAKSQFAGKVSARYAKAQEVLRATALLQTSVGIVADLLANLIVVAALIFGAWAVVRGSAPLGALIASYSLLAAVLPAVTRLVDLIISGGRATIVARRFRDTLEATPSDGPPVRSRPFPQVGSLKASDVIFEWKQGSKVLDCVNVTVPSGRLTGIWGPTGSGKSTLVHLFARRYEPTGGTIDVGGEPVSRIDLAAYRRNVAVLPESVPIVNGDLRTNILFGRDTGAANDIEACIAEIGLIGFLDRFEKGLETPVGETGRKLSAGERQVIGLLRAVLLRPAVLILDEGLNALDFEISQRVHVFLRRYARSRAVLIISHDPRILMQVDHLYVLNAGEIAESGPPAMLRRGEGLWSNACSGRRSPARVRHIATQLAGAL